MANQEIPFALVGAGGEPIDFARTIAGHGVTELPPMEVDTVAQRLSVTLTLPELPPRRVTIRSTLPAEGSITIHGHDADAAERGHILDAVRYVMRLDQDLSPFYAMAANDPELAWVIRGAGRMTRCLTVFEDVVKTICTTNCTWSATVRMVTALVSHLGEPIPGVPDEENKYRTFPTPHAMSMADDEFYRGIVKCGYRSTYLRTLSGAVVTGEVELESLAHITSEELADDALAKLLIALPGVGPYAAAHIMMMLGRYSRLVFDSWTRPTYARKMGRETMTDTEIIERFAPYGAYAGLAFWLAITEAWIPT